MTTGGWSATRKALVFGVPAMLGLPLVVADAVGFGEQLRKAGAVAALLADAPAPFLVLLTAAVTLAGVAAVARVRHRRGSYEATASERRRAQQSEQLAGYGAAALAAAATAAAPWIVEIWQRGVFGLTVGAAAAFACSTLLDETDDISGPVPPEGQEENGDAEIEADAPTDQTSEPPDVITEAQAPPRGAVLVGLVIVVGVVGGLVFSTSAHENGEIDSSGTTTTTISATPETGGEGDRVDPSGSGNSPPSTADPVDTTTTTTISEEALACEKKVGANAPEAVAAEMLRAYKRMSHDVLGCVVRGARALDSDANIWMQETELGANMYGWRFGPDTGAEDGAPRAAVLMPEVLTAIAPDSESDSRNAILPGFPTDRLECGTGQLHGFVDAEGYLVSVTIRVRQSGVYYYVTPDAFPAWASRLLQEALVPFPSGPMVENNGTIEMPLTNMEQPLRVDEVDEAFSGLTVADVVANCPVT